MDGGGARWGRVAAWGVAGATAAGAVPVMGAAFSDSARADGVLPLWTAFLAVVWLVGGIAVLAFTRRHRRPAPSGPPWLTGRPVLAATALAAMLSAVSLVGGLMLLVLPTAGEWIRSAVLTADSAPRVLTVGAALAAGAAEEVFFRLGLARMLRGAWAWIVPTVAYTLVTFASGNVALVLIAPVLSLVAMTALAVTGRWWSPLVVHGTWTITMFWLFPVAAAGVAALVR